MKLIVHLIRLLVLGLLAVLNLLLSYAPAYAEVVDTKVQLIAYDQHTTTLIKAKHGFVTQIDLAADEHIVKDGVGGGDGDNWVISANVGSNFILLKPKRNAHDCNLTVKTDKRSYIFDLRILSQHSADRGTWHVAFSYENEAPSPAVIKQQKMQAELAQIKALQVLPLPVKNTHYSMQVMPQSEGIAPKAAWDDGNFTYLVIPNHREIPAVFKVTADENETMVNTHMEGDNKDTIVIHGVAKRFVLRLSQQVVGIWNDAYDIDSGSPQHGTLIPNVSRKLLE